MEQLARYFEANKDIWNQRTPFHARSAFYDLEGFKGGKTSLMPIELAEVGDVRGKSLLHLQCHFGQDTLSWARLGAHVTGMDFSEEAIALARSLATELQLPAEFVCCNLYDLEAHLQEPFDIVFTSYGVLGWLPDLDEWARLVAKYLKPGGQFYLAEFHPVVWMMDEQVQNVKYSYFFNPSPITDEVNGTYADQDAPIKGTEYGWNHSLAEVVTALLRHGLQLEQLHEFPYSPYDCFANMVQGEDGMYRIAGKEELLPLAYSLKAVKQQRQPVSEAAAGRVA